MKARNEQIMNIELVKMHIENFKGIKELDISFGKNTKIYGQNATGKTSIVDAYNWCLFDKNSIGEAKFQIRPLDANNNQINHVEIKVSVTLRIDGREITF